LADHPKRATGGQQHPKKIPAPIRSAGIQEETGVGEERNEALRQVAESGKSGASPMESKRNGGVDNEEEKPDARHADNRFGGRHKMG
jgi:hypothetical protein